MEVVAPPSQLPPSAVASQVEGQVEEKSGNPPVVQPPAIAETPAAPKVGEAKKDGVEESKGLSNDSNGDKPPAAPVSQADKENKYV